MTTTTRGPVDMAELAEAMERATDGSYGRIAQAYVDRQTGAVLSVQLEEVDLDVGEPDDDERALREAIDADTTGRYVAIDGLETREQWRWLEAFAESLADERTRERLLDAISGKGAFSRFRSIVFPDPELRAGWYTFERLKQLESAREWLDMEDLGGEVAAPDVDEEPWRALTRPG